MNRRMFFILAALVVIVVVIVALLFHRNVRGPWFVYGTPAPGTPFTRNYYAATDVPLQNDRIWLSVLERPYGPGRVRYTNCLYDLRQRKVIGQLFMANPRLCNRDGSRILVEGYRPEAFYFYGGPLWRVLNSFGIRLSPPSQAIETFWTLDLSNNAAKKIGSISQSAHSTSSWYHSPDFRYGYTRPASRDIAIYLCDLERSSLTRIPIQGIPCGWWDENHILINALSDRFNLLDIHSHTTRSLFTASDFDSVLDRSKFTNSLPNLALANWNGTNYDFYFGYIAGRWGTKSFLLKASAVSPQLRLLDSHFQFERYGRFDQAGTHYLFSGSTNQPSPGGDGSVYLRDLASNTVTTLVPPDNSGQYAIPQFYRNEVIYYRSNILHRIGLDGSNDAPLLPPIEN